MADSNLANQSKTGSNPKVEYPTLSNLEEQNKDWFSIYLKYQVQNNAFFEYLIREDENGRK